MNLALAAPPHLHYPVEDRESYVSDILVVGYSSGPVQNLPGFKFLNCIVLLWTVQEGGFNFPAN